MDFGILKIEDISCDDFERLEFNGDAYIWDENGRRKIVEPEWAADEEWDDFYADECKHVQE